MKKVNGGVPPVCNVDNTCTVFIRLVGYLFANCSTDFMGSCTCSREYNGQVYYGDVGACMSAS